MILTFPIKNSKRNVNVELVGSREAIISSSTSHVKETIEKGKIVKICYEEDIEFKIGDEFEFELDRIKSKFKIDHFLKNDLPGRYYISCENLTLTSYFILPLLVDNFNQDRVWFELSRFSINAYLNKDLDKLNLVCRYNISMDYLQFENNLFTNSNYYKTIDPEKYLVVYQFFIPDLYKNDVNKIIQGKYSKLSLPAKKKIISFHKVYPKVSNDLFHILNRSTERKQILNIKLEINLDSEELKEVELQSKLDLTKEVKDYE